MKRPLVWSAIFTICGIYCRLGISEMICLVFFLSVLGATSYFVIKERDWKYALLLLFALVGFFAADAKAKWMERPMPYGEIAAEGLVCETGHTSGGNQKLMLRVAAEGTQEMQLYAIWTGEETFAVGDLVEFTGEIIPFDLPTYPGGYDEVRFLAMKGYEAKIFPEEMRKIGEEGSVTAAFAKGRVYLHGIMEQILPAEEAGILKALLTGEREDIPAETQELYTRAGVTHILCISGLHISILGLSLDLFLTRVLRCGRGLKTAALLLLSTLFLCFTGITPSAVRAVAMIYILALGKYWFCLYDRRTAIAAAAMLILLAEPLYLWHSGFQLSFATIWGISIGVERIEVNRPWKRTPIDNFKESVLISLYASLFSYPIVAYHFYWISTVGILANLVIIPLSGLLLGMGMLSVVLGILFTPAGIFAAGSVYVILQIYEKTCQLLTSLPYAYFLTGSPSLWTVLLCYLLLFLLLCAAERKRSWVGGVVVCAAIWCSVFGNRMLWKENTLAFLDVGQGDAALLVTHEKKAYLIDGGGLYGREFGENTGEMVVLPYLEYLGIDRLEGAFLSHMDEDHMIGLLEAADALPTKAIYLSHASVDLEKDNKIFREIVEKNEIPLYTVSNGNASVDGAWKCLYPYADIAFSAADSNLTSMVLSYEYGSTRILFTGDLPAEGERLLLQLGETLSADILKVSHHGSKGATTAEFLEAVSPEAAIISCGTRNLYGHPHGETLERLAESGAEIFRTDLDGSVILRLSPQDGYTIETMAEREPFYERIKKTMEGA